MELGQKLKEERSKAGMKQEELAQAIGVSRQTVSNWENNRSYPDIASVMKLSDLYGLSLDELLKELEIEIITYNDDTSSVRENAAFLIETYLETVGMRVEVNVLSKSKMSSRLKDGDFDLALIGVNLSEVPVLQPLLGSGGTLNFNGYSDSSMDELIMDTATVEDEAELKRVYSQIQLSLVERLPVMGLLFRTGTVLSNRSLAGLSGVRALNTFRGLEYLAE